MEHKREYTLLVDYDSSDGWSVKPALLIPNDELSTKDVEILERLNGRDNPHRYPNDDKGRSWKDRHFWDELFQKYRNEPTNARVCVIPPNACITRVYQMYRP